MKIGASRVPWGLRLRSQFTGSLGEARLRMGLAPLLLLRGGE